MILSIAHWVQALPHSRFYAAWPVAALLLFTLAGLILMFWRGRGCAAAVIPFYFWR